MLIFSAYYEFMWKAQSPRPSFQKGSLSVYVRLTSQSGGEKRGEDGTMVA